jgi:type VI protein secretion system component VasF
MTPQFAQYVDPIIEQMIDLLMAVERGGSPPGKGEWDRLNTKLQFAETELAPSYGKAWKLAKFALVSWADESVRNTNGWSGREWWLNNPLEFKHFKTLEANEMFFVNAKEAETVAKGEDAFETYYVCGMLGFRGFYEGESTSDERIRLTSEKYALPLRFSDWARDAGRVIRERRRLGGTAASAEQRERRIITAKPMWSRFLILWPWLLVAGLTALNVVVAWYP